MSELKLRNAQSAAKRFPGLSEKIKNYKIYKTKTFLRNEISRHMDSHQQKCKDCSFKCSNGRSLEVHRKAEHMFKCKKCKATLATKEALETHTTVAHMFKCQKCGTLFELKILLEKHFRALHMFKCPSCPQVQSISSSSVFIVC